MRATDSATETTALALPADTGIARVHLRVADLERALGFYQGVLASARDAPGSWEGLPPATIVGHVHFTVSHLERGAEFYHRVVGLDVTARWPTLVALSAGGYHHHLNLNTW